LNKLSSYTLPFVLSLLLHVVVIVVPVVISRSFSLIDNVTVFEPKAIRATLLVAEFDRARSATYEVQDTAVSLGAEGLENQTKLGQQEPDSVVEIKPNIENEKKRLQTLEELRNSTFDESLQRELQLLAENELDEESASYVNAIYSAIVLRWSRPPSARKEMETLLSVELFPNGELNTVNIIESSGNDAFDRSTLSAVKAVGLFSVPDDKDVFEAKFRKFNLRFRGEDLLR